MGSNPIGSTNFMIIELESPFKELYNKGYIVTKSLARYQMSVKLGRILAKEETVDHIDGDKTNDQIGNLQILTMQENIRKSASGRSMVTLICPHCYNPFTREVRQTHLVKGGTQTFCSRHCSAVYYRKLKK